MPERTLIIDHLKFSYDGLFSAAELYNLIASWFYEKGWDWYEKLNEEQITPEGKQIRIILEPWKSATDYHKIKIKIKLIMLDIKDVEVDHKNEKLRLDHGQVRMTFDGYILSDRNGKWENNPFFWFMSIIAEKYFFRHHFAKMERWIESDVEDLHNKIKSYLNVFKYTYQRK